MTGRPKTFDRDAALLRVTELFWAQGYAACSLRELEQATCLGRQSLYNEFGDKRALYLAALDLYIDHHSRATLAPLEGKGTPLARVRAVLDGVAEAAATPGWQGCMVVNAAVEGAAADPEVGARVRAAVSWQDAAFARVLRDAVRAGELPADHPVDATASALTAALQAMALRGRMGADEAEIKQLRAGLERLLRP